MHNTVLTLGQSALSHIPRIYCYIINNRITPIIIEQHLSDNQMRSRKGRGTRHAIFKFRTVAKRAVQVNKKLFTCFVDYQKAFDRINHEQLMSILESAGIPEQERNLIKSLN